MKNKVHGHFRKPSMKSIFICGEKNLKKPQGFQVSTADASESSPQGLSELIILYFIMESKTIPPFFQMP